MKPTRKEAIDAIERYYCTGKPCKRGHIAKRYTITGACCACMTEASRAEQRLIREQFRAAEIEK
jgi:hypothetical protein